MTANRALQRLYIIFAVMLTLFGQAGAQTVSESLSAQLAKAATPTDSMAALYNLVDHSTGRQQTKALGELFDMAVRNNDENTLLEVLRIGANLNANNDSILGALADYAGALPASDSQRATTLFIKVLRETRQIKALPPDISDKRLRQYLSSHKNINELDLYDKIEFLFKLCSYMRVATEGDLLMQYFAELQDLIDRLPARELNLRMMFYTRAADIYLENGMYEEAVAANKTLLDIIEQLEKQYKAMGRDFPNYNRAKYLCYRRLLKCRPVITPEIADDYYVLLLNVPRQSPDIRRDFEENKIPTIYYLMAKQHYSEALPLIARQINDTDDQNPEYRSMVEAMIEAADALGDNDHLLKALEINNRILRRHIEERTARSDKELQIVYEVNELKQENDDLVLANQQIMVNRHNEQLTYITISLVVLIALLVIVLFYYRRAKRLSASLAESNNVFAGERDALKRAQKELIEARDKAKTADRIKTDFVNNMGHEIRTPLAAIREYSHVIADCADADKRGYIKRFANIISLNIDLLLTLVNDVLELPAIENAKNCVRLTPASAKDICCKAIDAVRQHIAPDVQLIFHNEHGIDVNLTTDPVRAKQVITILLSNAAKFTESGTITIDYSLVDKGRMLSFIVTDTGIGIPLGKEEVIFSRFEKLNSSTEGKGLGLYIGRLMAHLLKGELILDSHYRKGARFIFTIPVNYDEK